MKKTQWSTCNEDGGEDGSKDSGAEGDDDGDTSLAKAGDNVMLRRVWSLPVGGSLYTPIAMYENNMGQCEKWRLGYTSE